MGVSKNNGTPESSILIGFSLINHPFWGTTNLETPISSQHISHNKMGGLSWSFRTEACFRLTLRPFGCQISAPNGLFLVGFLGLKFQTRLEDSGLKMFHTNAKQTCFRLGPTDLSGCSEGHILLT